MRRWDQPGATGRTTTDQGDTPVTDVTSTCLPGCRPGAHVACPAPAPCPADCPNRAIPHGHASGYRADLLTGPDRAQEYADTYADEHNAAHDLMREAADHPHDNEERALLLAEANVHAGLAQAAATMHAAQVTADRDAHRYALNLAAIDRHLSEPWPPTERDTSRPEV